jgi:two-component system clock-associated histidine kinase SasA
VIDDGPGISEEDQHRLFSKFEQINRPISQGGYKGTGLGLAICKEIIDQHQGRIWVESRPGKGANFHFTLPMKQEREG